MSPHGLVSVVVATVLGMPGCGGAGGTRTDASGSDAQDGDMGSVDVGTPEKRCGETNTYFSAYNAEQIAKLSDCTVLVGWFQQDSVFELEDFAGLEKVRTIEGRLNVFRSAFRTLRGFDNLEIIEGHLFIHQNWNLTNISALGNLHTITGDLYITDNTRLPRAEIDALVARVKVGGTTMVGAATDP